MSDDRDDAGDGDGCEPLPLTVELAKHGRRPRSLWSRSLTILQGGGPQVVVDVKCDDPGGPPQCYALITTMGLGGTANPTYDVFVGIGEDAFNWIALPGLAPNAVRIVAAHAVRIVAHGAPGAASALFAAAVPTGAAPTLTP